MTVELPRWRDLARRLDELGVDLSDYSDDFAWGFVAGADHVQQGVNANGAPFIPDRLQVEARDLMGALRDLVTDPPIDLHDEECAVLGEAVICIEGCRVRNGREAMYAWAEKGRP